MATLNYTPTVEDLQEMKREFLRLDAADLGIIAWTTAGTIHKCPICDGGVERDLARLCGHQACTCGPDEYLTYLNTGIY